MRVSRAAVIAGRVFVAGVFLVYGLLKLAGGQFVPGEFRFDSQSDSMVTLVWHFYGYSPVYHRFIGLAEVVPAVLLLCSYRSEYAQTSACLRVLSAAHAADATLDCRQLPVAALERTRGRTGLRPRAFTAAVPGPGRVTSAWP